MKYYAIYDLNDNFVTICESYRELSHFFKRTIRCMHSSVTRFNQGKINSIISNDDGKHYKVYRMKDLQD